MSPEWSAYTQLLQAMSSTLVAILVGRPKQEKSVFPTVANRPKVGMYSHLLDLHNVKPSTIVTGWTIVHSSPSTIIFIAVGLMFLDNRHILGTLL